MQYYIDLFRELYFCPFGFSQVRTNVRQGDLL